MVNEGNRLSAYARRSAVQRRGAPELWCVSPCSWRVSERKQIFLASRRDPMTRMRWALLPLAFLLAALPPAHMVLAEDDDVERLERMNSRAVQAYRRSNVRAARSSLERAIRMAKHAGIGGTALARTYVNLGIVVAAGAFGHERAVRAFRHALRLDPRIRLEPDAQTAAALTAFREASDAYSQHEDARDSQERVPLGEGNAPVRAPSPAEVAGSTWQEARPEIETLRARESAAMVVETAPTIQPAADTLHGLHEHPPWFIEVSMGIGFSALHRQNAPDRPPPASMLEELEASTLDSATQRAHATEAERELKKEGWDCEARAENGRLAARDCVVATNPGVSVIEPIFDLAIGYHVRPRLSVALSALVQRNAGQGPLAGVGVGLRTEYLLVASHHGPQLGIIAGGGTGVLRARGRGRGEEGPAATNAAPGRVGAIVSVGLKSAYRLNRYLALTLMPLFNVGLPYVMYDVGVTGGVEVGF